MYQLSEQQIDYIFNDISARGVEMESLQQNLHDHICCIIENDLEENGDFESFYQKTIRTFYKDNLWEIEEETLLLLTYKNYYTMKKVMINSGIAAATFFIIGSFFKFMHWPGAAVLILTGMAIGALVFLPLTFMFKKNETNESRAKLVLGIGTINGILFCMYSLFKVMHWPGASMLWFLTLGLFTLMFIPLYFFNGIKNPTNKVNTITTTIILIMVAGVFFLQTSLKPYTRHLNNNEIDIIVKDEEMLKTEAQRIYEVSKKDTSFVKADKRVKEINEICNDIKSQIIEYETGYKAITNELKDKNIILSAALVSNFMDNNKKVEKQLNRLSNLTFENSFNCYVEKLRLTKKEDTKKYITFESSILQYPYFNQYYNNTIFGAYKDLCEIQLDAMQEVENLIDLKDAMTK